MVPLLNALSTGLETVLKVLPYEPLYVSTLRSNFSLFFTFCSAIKPLFFFIFSMASLTFSILAYSDFPLTYVFSIVFTLAFMIFSSSFLISCTSASRFCLSWFLILTSSLIFLFVDVGFLISSMTFLLLRFKPCAFAYCDRDVRLFLSSPSNTSVIIFFILDSTPSMFLAANGF